MAVLAVQFNEGHGVPIQQDRARKWAQFAFKHGIERVAKISPLALFILGRLLKAGYTGHTATADTRLTIALQYFQEAAERGVSYAWYSLGRAYLIGEGMDGPLKPEAYMCFQRGYTEIGCAYCLNSLGSMNYFERDEFSHNRNLALLPMLKSAHMGNSYAQVNYSKLFPQSPEDEIQDIPDLTPLSLLIKAADQGHADASAHLGLRYIENGPNDPNFSTGIRLLTAAARRGSVEAQYQLGRMYWYGNDVTRDHTAAHLYLSQAAASLHPAAYRLLFEIENQQDD